MIVLVFQVFRRLYSLTVMQVLPVLFLAQRSERCAVVLPLTTLKASKENKEPRPSACVAKWEQMLHDHD